MIQPTECNESTETSHSFHENIAFFSTPSEGTVEPIFYEKNKQSIAVSDEASVRGK